MKLATKLMEGLRKRMETEAESRRSKAGDLAKSIRERRFWSARIEREKSTDDRGGDK